MSGVSSGMKDINAGFSQLSESMESLSKMAEVLAGCEDMMNDLEIILKAFQNNWFLKKEVELVKKELDMKNNKGDKK
jgi:hypothetical protein